MMTDTKNPDRAYILNTRIVADEFEDETVLINVEKGLYFSMQGSAKEIWQAFTEPRSSAAVIAGLSEQLGDAERAEVARNVQLMIEHGLIIETEAASSPGTKLMSFAATHFALPVLAVFSDLSELIAIDPVHEVDESAGWPVRPASFPGLA